MDKEEIRYQRETTEAIEKRITTATNWLFWIAAAGIWIVVMWQAATYYFGRLL